MLEEKSPAIHPYDGKQAPNATYHPRNYLELIETLGHTLFTRDQLLLIEHARMLAGLHNLEEAIKNHIELILSTRFNLEDEDPDFDKRLVTAASNAISILHYGHLCHMFRFQLGQVMDWSYCRIPDADLSMAIMNECNFDHADLSRALIFFTRMYNCSFRHARLAGVETFQHHMMNRVPALSSSSLIMQDGKTIVRPDYMKARITEPGQTASSVEHKLPARILAAAMLPGSDSIVYGTVAGHVQLLEKTTGRCILELNHQPSSAENPPGPRQCPVPRLNNIHQIKFSQDGEYLAAADPQRVAIWSVSNDYQLVTVLDAQSVSNFSFSPDSRFIAIAGERSLKCWDLHSARYILDERPQQLTDVSGVVFAYDGEKIVVNGNRALHFWDLTLGTCLQTTAISYEFTEDDVYEYMERAGTCPDLTALVAKDAPEELQACFDLFALVRSLRLVLPLPYIGLALEAFRPCHDYCYARLEPFSDRQWSSRILHRSDLQKMWQWSYTLAFYLRQNNMLAARHEAAHVSSLALVPHQNAFAAAERKSTPEGRHAEQSWCVNIYHLHAAHPRAKCTVDFTASRDARINGVRFAQDGRTMIVLRGSSSLDVWDTELRTKKCTISEFVIRGLYTDTQRNSLMSSVAAISPDGSVVAVATDGRTPIRLFSSADGSHDPDTQVIDGSTLAVNDLAFSPDGSTLSVVGISHESDGDNDPENFQFLTLLVLDMVTRKQKWKLRAKHTELWDRKVRPTSLAYSPDSRHVAVAGPDQFARVWNVISGCLKFVLRSHDAVGSVNYSPEVQFSHDGKYILTSTTNVLRAWDAFTGECLGVLPIRGKNLVLTADDAHIISTLGSESGIEIWKINWDALLAGKVDAVQLEHYIGTSNQLTLHAFFDGATLEPDLAHLISQLPYKPSHAAAALNPRVQSIHMKYFQSPEFFDNSFISQAERNARRTELLSIFEPDGLSTRCSDEKSSRELEASLEDRSDSMTLNAEQNVPALIMAAEAGNTMALKELFAHAREEYRAVLQEEGQRYDELLQKAARLGIPLAQRLLGCKHLENEQDPHDFDLAFEWMLNAAESGDVEAQFLVGTLYQKRQQQRAGLFTIPPDPSMPFQWFARAALQGHAEAQYRLATEYMRGFGVNRNWRNAVIWLKKAAEQGHVQAMKDLAECYMNGQGVPQDPDRANFWAAKAAPPVPM